VRFDTWHPWRQGHQAAPVVAGVSGCLISRVGAEFVHRRHQFRLSADGVKWAGVDYEHEKIGEELLRMFVRPLAPSPLKCLANQFDSEHETAPGWIASCIFGEVRRFLKSRDGHVLREITHTLNE